MTIDITRQGPVERVTLNRPDVRNAINDEVVAELSAWAAATRDDPDIRVTVLSGAGKVFSAGADLDFMARAIDYDRERNVADALRMAAMFRAIDTLPRPLIGKVHGAALGGGAGLAAVCDLVVADRETVFGFTEVKLGIMPAVIAPFAIAKIGASAARALFLTGARFSAERAREIGLVHELAAGSDLEASVDRIVHEFLTSGPESIREAKNLIAEVVGRRAVDVADITAAAIAARRMSPEGQEGMKAFLEKRKAEWRSEREELRIEKNGKI